MPRKVILAGGSGLVGRALARTLQAGGWEPVVLTRSPRPEAKIREVAWNGETGGPWTAELAGAEAIVNLAGSSIDCVHTLAASREIRESRLNAVHALGKALAKTKSPPSVWVQASAVGYYGRSGGALCDEQTPAGQDFLAAVCRDWEAAMQTACPAATRAVVLRFGVVLSRQGGAYPVLARLTRNFLGGTAGPGTQGISWVHLDDVTQALRQGLARDDLAGAYNVCSPRPATNAEFMAALRRSLGRPWAPPAPAFAVRLAATHLLKTDPSLVLGGRRCVPSRLLAQGFRFEFADLEPALHDLANPHPGSPA